MLKNHAQARAYAFQLAGIAADRYTVPAFMAAQGFAADMDQAFVRHHQMVDTAQKRAFSGARRADDGMTRALVGGERDPGTDFAGTNGLRDVFYPDGEFACVPGEKRVAVGERKGRTGQIE